MDLASQFRTLADRFHTIAKRPDGANVYTALHHAAASGGALIREAVDARLIEFPEGLKSLLDWPKDCNIGPTEQAELTLFTQSVVWTSFCLTTDVANPFVLRRVGVPANGVTLFETSPHDWQTRAENFAAIAGRIADLIATSHEEWSEPMDKSDIATAIDRDVKTLNRWVTTGKIELKPCGGKWRYRLPEK